MRMFQKSAAVAASLALLILWLVFPITPAAAEKKQIRLQWAFGALTGPEDNPQFLAIEEKAILHSGDRIKIFLQPETDCHLFLFYRSSQGELIVLLPEQGGASMTAAGIQKMIPDADQWFKLDTVTGRESFYLLASARPLENLESLCRKMSAAPSAAERAAIGQDILSEVRRLRKKRPTLTAAAERPVRLGGNFRGVTEPAAPKLPDLSRIAMEISAADFYSRTFTIDHQ